MSPETIRGLGGHTPGNQKLRFINIRAANDEIARLEQRLAATATPHPLEPAVGTAGLQDILAQLAAVDHPSDKVAFYRANKSAIDRAMRDAPAPKQGHARPTGNPQIDALSEIQDPQKRVAHYRKNKDAIDAAYRNLP